MNSKDSTVSIVSNKYIVFGGFNDFLFPDRRMNDIIEIYDNVDDAILYVYEHLELDWLHIYELNTKKIIWNKRNL